MKIHGHSIIELKNETTGEVERYEDDNLVTNAINMYLQDLGGLCKSPIYNANVRSDFITSLFGGLLLLDTALPETADTVICPGGVKMVGNGTYNLTADGDDGVTELGSWNSTNSGWASDGSYKFEWDFIKEQANGNIACACLTSANHGYIGEGNTNENGASRTDKRSDYTLTGEIQPYLIDTNEQQLKRIIGISRTDSTVSYIEENNFFYNASTADQHMGQTGKVKVITQKIPLTKLDLRMTIPARSTQGDSYIPTIETEISLPPQFVSQLGNKTPLHAGRSGNYYYMLALSPNGLASGSSVEGVKIDPATMTASRFTITNTLGYTIGVSTVGISGVMFGSDTAAVYCSYRDSENAYHYGVMFQDITDNVDTSFVEGNFGDNASQNHMREEHCIYNGYKIDYVDRSVLPTNSTGGNYCGGLSFISDNPLVEDWMTYVVNQGWVNQQLRLAPVTDYLATINNLSSPVTKTAEKSMKVTYVLRFDDGE